jgi:hypothetical protein
MPSRSNKKLAAAGAGKHDQVSTMLGGNVTMLMWRRSSARKALSRCVGCANRLTGLGSLLGLNGALLTHGSKNDDVWSEWLVAGDRCL